MEQQTKQYRKIIHLTFSPDNSGRPVMCELVRRYDVTFNIVAARTTPGKEGYLTIEISGEEENCRQSLQYLRDEGIIVVAARQHVSRRDEVCMHCGMCLALCPVKALDVEPDSRRVRFHEEECTACGMCTRVCPVGAMQSDVETGVNSVGTGS